MKSKKWMFLTVCLMLVFSLVLAGCSSSGNNNTPPPANEGTNNSDNSENSKKPQQDENVTITYSQWGTAEELQRIQQLLDIFMEQHPNIKVKLEGKDWGSYWDGLTANAAGGTLPDVMKTSYAYIETYAKLGIFKELDGLLSGNNFDLDSIADSMRGLHRHDGNQVSMPIDANVIVFYYSKDLFDDSATNPKGASYPGLYPTWDEIVDIAKKMTLDENNNTAEDPGFDANRIKQWGLALAPGSTMDWFLEPMLWSNDAKLLNDDETLALDTPEAREVLEFFIDITKNQKINTNPAQLEALGGQANLGITTGKVAMNAGGSWNVSHFQEADVNYGITHLPKFKTTQTVVQPAGVAISSSTKHEEAAYTLLAWLVGEGGQTELAKQGFSIPSNSQAAQAYLDTAGEEFQIFLDAQEFGIISPFTETKADLIWTYSEQIMKEPLAGDGDLDAAIAEFGSMIR